MPIIGNINSIGGFSVFWLMSGPWSHYILVETLLPHSTANFPRLVL